MRILLVDDDDMYLSFITELLKEQGYEVSEATDGKQARERLESDVIDLIISDIFMPTLDGVLFHSYVREFSNRPEVPFVFVSGIDDPQTRGAVLNPGLDYFVSKSAPIADLLRCVEGCFRHSKTINA